MANTITNKVVSAGSNRVAVYIALASDGSEETATVIYDSSAIATLVGDTDTLDCTIQELYATVCSAATARVTLLWDAITDVLAIGIPAGTAQTHKDFRRCGGLANQGGTGKTGDILLTTTGLEAGDTITFYLELKRN